MLIDKIVINGKPVILIIGIPNIELVTFRFTNQSTVVSLSSAYFLWHYTNFLNKRNMQYKKITIKKIGDLILKLFYRCSLIF